MEIYQRDIHQKIIKLSVEKKPPNVGKLCGVSCRKILNANVGYVNINRPQGNSQSIEVESLCKNNLTV